MTRYAAIYRALQEALPLSARQGRILRASMAQAVLRWRPEGTPLSFPDMSRAGEVERQWLTWQTVRTLLHEEGEPVTDGESTRHVERGDGKGATDAEVARRLGMSPRTVERWREDWAVYGLPDDPESLRGYPGIPPG